MISPEMEHSRFFVVARLLNKGVDKNFRTGNGTSLLHKVSLSCHSNMHQ